MIFSVMRQFDYGVWGFGGLGVLGFWGFGGDALAYAKTEQFKHEMRSRSNVERMIAIFVLFCGGRRAIFRSLPKVDFQVKMQATMFNLKAWCALDDKKKRDMYPKPSRRFRAAVPDPDG